LQWALETNQEAPPRFAIEMELEKMRCIQALLYKSVLEDMRRDKPDSLTSFVVRLAQQPTVLVSTTINPLVTFTGRVLDSRWDWLTASIIPSGDGGWAVFTWNKSDSKNPSLFMKSFVNIAKELQTVALLNFVFESSNQFAIAPEWWELLSQERRKDLFRRFGRSLKRGSEKPAADTLLPKAAWVDWQPEEARYV
jgi:hypothetical protein